MNTSFSNFASLLGIQNLPPEEAEKFAETIAPIMFERFLIRIEPLLSEADVATLQSLLVTAEPEEIMAFIERSVPNFKEEVRAFVSGA